LLSAPRQVLFDAFAFGHVLQGLDDDEELALAVVDRRRIEDDVPVLSVHVQIPALGMHAVGNKGRSRVLAVQR